MLSRLPALLALAALALLPSTAGAFTAPLPPDSVTILSGNDTLDAALPAPANASRGDHRGALSDDGLTVAFTSGADGLSAEDDDRFENVFVKDRTTGAVILASRRTGVQGEPAHGDCSSATISDDGQLVAMACTAPLAGADGNGRTDVYVRDLAAAKTILVSRVAGGPAGNGLSYEPMISGNGGTVVYSSTATNLVAADTNPQTDVYSRSVEDGFATVLVSRADGAGGAIGDADSGDPSVSDDGSTVAFASKASNLRLASDANLLTDVYVRNVNAGTTELVSARSGEAEAIGNGDSHSPSISGQEPYRVAFTSDAHNFGPTDANGAPDVYVRSLMFDTTALVSRKAAGYEAANGASFAGGIDDSGVHVAFGSHATDLVPAAADDNGNAYVRHLGAGSTELLSRAGADGPAFGNGAGSAAVSGDGTAYMWHSEGGGGLPDADPVVGNLFLRDLDAAPRTTELVARPAGSEPFVNAGASAWLRPSARTVSADGSRVVFGRSRDGVSQAFVRDLRTGALILASRADGADGAPSTREASYATISADGRRVAFLTEAKLDPADGSDLVSAYVRDLETGRTYLASRADGAAGADANNQLNNALALSGDGNRVAFVTAATNLGDGDTAPDWDVHVRDLAAGATILGARGAGGQPLNGAPYDPALDGDGSHLAFATIATNLVDPDAWDDVYLSDLATGTIRLVSEAPGVPKGAGNSFGPMISADGSTVAFMSYAPSLGAAGGPHVVVRDMARDTLTVADRADGAGGAVANARAFGPSISADGRSVAWTTRATNLVPDHNSSETTQVYVRDLGAGATRLVSRAGGAGGAPLEHNSQDAALSGDGACAVFTTRAPLAPGAGTDFPQVYMRAIAPGCVPALPSGGGAGEPAKDTTAPVLSKVALKRKRFAVGRKPRGTVLRFGLSEPAQVKLRVRRVRGSLVRAKGAGAGRLRFSGRIGGRALRPGRHRMIVTATDAAGNRSPRVILRFRIVRR